MCVDFRILYKFFIVNKNYILDYFKYLLVIFVIIGFLFFVEFDV